MFTDWAMKAGDMLFNLEPRWVRRRPQLFGWMYTINGLCLTLLTAVLYRYDRGGWWGAVLVPGAAANLSVAYRMLRGPDER